MNNRKHYSALSAVLSIAFVFVLAGTAFGQQTVDAKNGAAAQNAHTQQGGASAADLDLAKNTVQLPATASAPSALKVSGSGSGRIPFQRRMIVTPTGTGFSTEFMPIPAGKRLVIENISAISRAPEGIRMEMNYFTYFDNGDGQGGIAAITFHRIALSDQGNIDGMSIATANHKVLVFAEEQIGATHYQVGVQARLSAMTTGFVQAQITFSGYLEDLATAQ